MYANVRAYISIAVYIKRDEYICKCIYVCMCVCALLGSFKKGTEITRFNLSI